MSFFILSMLYPQLRFQDQTFHQDHMHPFSHFNADNLTLLGISKTEQDEWMKHRDTVPNLQLLNGRLNESKNATKLVDWVARIDENKKDAYLRENYFPKDVGLEFSEFMTFYSERKELLRTQLKTVLTVSNELPAVDSDDSDNDEEFGVHQVENSEEITS